MALMAELNKSTVVQEVCVVVNGAGRPPRLLEFNLAEVVWQFGEHTRNSKGQRSVQYRALALLHEISLYNGKIFSNDRSSDTNYPVIKRLRSGKED